MSEITLLFAGGNQTAKEVVDALAHNSTILGVKGARGVNNPDTYLDGKPRAFLEAAELLEVVTKYVIRHKVTKVTSEDIDRVITAYIYGENKPTTKDFTDVENQKRLVFNPTSYDSNTKLELFLQMRALLKDPKVYTKLPNHCVILDISEIEKLPKVFNSLINREVSPRYYNLPKYKLETIDCSNGFNPTDNQYQRICRDGFFQIKIPPKLKPHIECLRRFNKECFSSLKHKYDWRFNKAHPSVIGPVDGYMEDNVHPMSKLDSNKNRNNQVVRMTLGKLPEKNLWKHYPLEVQLAAIEIEKFGQKMIQSILDKLEISPEDFIKASGGASSGLGSTYLCNNKMDASIKGKRALALHKDWSYLTALIRSSDPGLAAEIDGQWMRVQPDDDSILINFGTTFELLTESLPINEQIKASNHFVVQKGKDSLSSAMFFDHHPSKAMYKIEKLRGKAQLVENSKFSNFTDYAIQMSKTTYDTPQDADEISVAPIAKCKAHLFNQRQKRAFSRL